MPLLKLPRIPGLDTLTQAPPSAEQDAGWGVAPADTTARMASTIPSSGQANGYMPPVTANTVYSRATGNAPNLGYNADATAGSMTDQQVSDMAAQQQFEREQASVRGGLSPAGVQQEVMGSPDQGGPLGQMASFAAAPLNTLGEYPLKSGGLLSRIGLDQATPNQVIGAPSAAVRQIPGEQSAPAWLRAPAEMLPYAIPAILSGGLAAAPGALGAAAASGLGGYGASEGVKALGGNADQQQVAGLVGMLGGAKAFGAASRVAPVAGRAVARMGASALENTAPTLEGVARPATAPDALLRGEGLPTVVNPTRPGEMVPTVAGGAALPGDATGAYPFGPRGNPANDVAPAEGELRAFKPQAYMDANGNLITPPAPKPPVPAAEVAPPVETPPAAEPPLSDLERQMQASLVAGKKGQPSASEAMAPEQIKEVLDANGFSTDGTPSELVSRYRGMIAGYTGEGTATENVANAARAAYEKTLADTGDPAAATAAGRKAARSEQQANARAGQLAERMRQTGQDPAKTVETLVQNAVNDKKGTVLNGGIPPSLIKGLIQQVLPTIASIPGEAIGLTSSLSPPLLRQMKVALGVRPAATMREFFQSMKTVASTRTFEEIDSTIRNDSFVRDSGVRIDPKTGEMRTTDKAIVDKLAQERYSAGRGVANDGGHPMANAGLTYQDVGGTILEQGDNVPAELRVEERQTGQDTRLGRGIREVIAPSDRQAVAEVNLARTGWYGEVAQQMFDAGIRDVNKYIKLRQFIEAATGRGPVPEMFKHLPVFFSMSAQSARFRYLWYLATEVPRATVKGENLPFRLKDGKVAWGGEVTPGVGREATKALVGQVVVNAIELGTLAALGYGTVKTSKTGLPILYNKATGLHIDPWAGINSQAKLILGIGKDIYDEQQHQAKVVDDPSAVPQDMIQRLTPRLAKYLQGGFSPVYGAAASAYTGKDFTGAPYDLGQKLRSGQVVTDVATPFVIRDIIDAYGATGTAAGSASTAPLSFLSEGVNYYKPVSEQRDTESQKQFSKNYADLTSRYDKQAVDAAIGHVAGTWHDVPTSTLGAAEAALRSEGLKQQTSVTFNGLGRAINDSDESWKAWQDSKVLLDKYYTKLVPQFGDTVAKEIYDGRKFSELSLAEQADVQSSLRASAQKQSPQLDAWLAWWGGSDSLQSVAAMEAFKEIATKYGKVPPNGKAWTVHLAAGVE